MQKRLANKTMFSEDIYFYLFNSYINLKMGILFVATLETYIKFSNLAD